MMNLYLMMLIVFLSIVVSGTNDYKFFPNLPAGEYKVNYVAVLRDKHMINHSIQLDYYFYKVTRNITELRGSITYKTPFDDSYNIHVNFAVKDSIGGWKDNAVIATSPKACSTLQKSLGAQLPVVFNKMGFNDTKCPIPPGRYATKGFEISTAALTLNLPKVFFYGSYKASLYFTDKNKNICGRIVFVIDIIRPWENV